MIILLVCAGISAVLAVIAVEAASSAVEQRHRDREDSWKQAHIEVYREELKRRGESYK